MRIYHNFTSDTVQELPNTFTAYENVDLCNITEIIQAGLGKFINSDIFPMTWRWVYE